MKSLIKILENELIKGYVFFPFGGIERPLLERLLLDVDFKIPEELIEIWEKYGGGDLFETETILSPNHKSQSENIFYYNRFDNSIKDLFFFHTGIFNSGIDKNGEIWIVHSNGNRNKVRSMRDWYENLKSSCCG